MQGCTASRAASPDVNDAGTVAYRKLFTAQVIESEHAVVQRHPITGELVLLVGHFAKRLVVLNAAVGWDGSASVQLAGN